MTLFKFGGLMCSVITTTRKFFTLLLSVVLFGHVLSVLQWQSVGIVFVGLMLDTYQGYVKRESAKDADTSKTKKNE
jgi:drug/metabolite transporter (DMT)-like permease